MGCCTSCCRQGKREYQEIKGNTEAEEGGGGSGDERPESGRSSRSDSISHWDLEFLENKTSKWDFVTHAAIFAFHSGKLKAAVPNSFSPNATGVNDIISALKGDTSGLEQRSVALGSQTPVCTPGKIDNGKAIYCSDSRGEGGCIAIKTKESLLVVFYSGNADTALTLTSEMAEFMEENGR